MDIVCLDLEGVLVPEIWIAFAEASGIPELKRTTRDEPDYDKLMTWRLGIQGAWSWTQGDSGDDRKDRSDPRRKGVFGRASFHHTGDYYQRYLHTVCKSADEEAGLADNFL